MYGGERQVVRSVSVKRRLHRPKQDANRHDAARPLVGAAGASGALVVLRMLLPSNAWHPTRTRLAAGPLPCRWLLIGVAVSEASICVGEPRRAQSVAALIPVPWWSFGAGVELRSRIGPRQRVTRKAVRRVSVRQSRGRSGPSRVVIGYLYNARYIGLRTTYIVGYLALRPSGGA